jgi:hypothetical protein
VDAAELDQDRDAVELAEDQAPGVARNRRRGEPRQLVERELGPHVQVLLDRVAEARAEHHRHAGLEAAGAGANQGRPPLRVIVAGPGKGGHSRASSRDFMASIRSIGDGSMPASSPR